MPIAGVPTHPGLLPASTVRPVGRFAPSPTGPLHFGSLLAALASYLDIRSRKGCWLVRIEDLDPPREQPGAADHILRTLDAFGLHWDGQVVYQSQRLELYQAALEQLRRQEQAYPCNCSRKQLQQRQVQGYDGYCLKHPPASADDCAFRVSHPPGMEEFHDRIQGQRQYCRQGHEGDFVVFRRDGLFAYQLAVVVDDADQAVTDILRGSDLIDETPHQLRLQSCLGYMHPTYAHIPVITHANGQKLSKQNLAPAIDSGQRLQLLIHALRLLGQSPPAELQDARLEELLRWAVEHWTIARVPAVLSMPQEKT